MIEPMSEIMDGFLSHFWLNILKRNIKSSNKLIDKKSNKLIK
jgi:hypothetical protein